MKKYFVQMQITRHYDYEMEVEAIDEETAIDLAEQQVYMDRGLGLTEHCDQEVEVLDIHEEEAEDG